MVLMKYKPIYKVSIYGKELGYIQNKELFEKMVKDRVIENKGKNVDTIDLKTNPQYELKLVNRTIETNEKEMIDIIQQDVQITYKYYEIALNNEAMESVNTLEEAEELVQKIKEEQENEINISIIEKYTENENEIKTTHLEVAKNEIQMKVSQKLEEQEKIKNMPEINGIKLACTPVSGTITSRYGVRSRMRVSTHTGLDIGAKTGSKIHVVASGVVTCASYQGAYGNLVKVEHGNGVETWYAHTSKMHVSVGQKVESGETIAEVGSTGNSTGSHLHLEIRVNGKHINPQNYLYH